MAAEFRPPDKDYEQVWLAGRSSSSEATTASPLPAVKPSASQSAMLDVRWRKLPGLLHPAGGSEHLFMTLFAALSQSDLFWLDRSGPCILHQVKIPISR